MGYIRVCACFLVYFGIKSTYTQDESIPFSSPYYDPSTRQSLRLTSVENVLVGVKQTTKNTHNSPYKTVRRIGFRSNGCSCSNFLCGCCLGINLNQFNFNREGCLNFTYDPDEFAINMNVLMNNNNIYSNSFSAKNPPPLCIPLPVPYIPLQVQACARIYDVYAPGQNLHMCLDFETRVQQATVLVLHFDCMRFGMDGAAFLKPEDGSGLPQGPGPAGEAGQVDGDVYDEVTETKYSIRRGNELV
ncbi:unnamed protein product [Phyllotreta striolata]|uniref:DUF4773 domain-containing protein n=1 Tax=Phyllotreta striolata TaxID=444603 RepID=A0A9N9TRI5_PHYSR|nr:unnamed protein product [Phyllotreta striolata]